MIPMIKQWYPIYRHTDYFFLSCAKNKKENNGYKVFNKNSVFKIVPQLANLNYANSSV